MSTYGKQYLLHCPNRDKDELASLVYYDILWTVNTPISVYATYFQCPCGSIHKVKWDGKITNATKEEVDFLYKRGLLPCKLKSVECIE